jgi:pyrroloquinoline quinone (PQQ) biosynthesis protein C
VKDHLLQRYVRYRNYAEELRIIAAETRTRSVSDDLLSAAAQYDQMADSLDAIMRAKTMINA